MHITVTVKPLAAAAAMLPVGALASACGSTPTTSAATPTTTSQVVRVDYNNHPTGLVAVEIKRPSGPAWVTRYLGDGPYTLVDGAGKQVAASTSTACMGLAVLSAPQLHAPSGLALASSTPSAVWLHGEKVHLAGHNPLLRTVADPAALPPVGTPGFSRPGVLGGLYAGRGMFDTSARINLAFLGC